jgi:Ca2+/H+ antiporter
MGTTNNKSSLGWARRILLAHPRLLLLFFVPMAVDLLLQNNHWSRLITGMAAAFPVAFFVHEAVEQIHIKSIRRIFS